MHVHAAARPGAEQAARALLAQLGVEHRAQALPRELSGGMRQRVGIARALVTEPDLLLMDEAFSALDVLTGENLRDEMLDLWEDRRTKIKAILIVSHNIEEAVMMADRIVILSSDPGRIRAEVRVPFPRPRNRDSAAVRNLIDEVYGLMTSPERVGVHVGAESAAQQLAYRLPEAEIGQMEAILDLLVEAPFNGRADLPHLAEEAGVTDDDLLPACEALALLQLATIERGDIIVTPFGKTYMETEPPERKVLFGQKLLEQVALASHIRAELEANEDGEIREEQVLRELEAYLKPEEAERVLKIGIEWGRYGEVYEYVYNTGMLTLPREEREEREEREAQEGGDGAAGA